MSFNDDSADDSAGFRPPPHPDDRLWRHPSELAQPAREPTPPGPRSTTVQGWGATLAVAAAGVVLVAAGAGVMSLGLRKQAAEVDPIEQVLVSPLEGSAAPMVPLGPRGPSSTESEYVQVIEDLAPTVVRIDGGETRGSGVVVRDDGVILTSAEVVGNSSLVAVALGDGRLVTGETVGTDPLTGLAVIKLLPGEDYEAASWPDPAAGLPASGTAISLGVDENGLLVVGAGRLDEAPTAVQREDRGLLDGVLSLEVRTHPLARGGPVVSPDGTLVGVVTWTDAGRAYATPAAVAQRVTDDLLSRGEAQHTWLGIDGYVLVKGDEPAGVAVASVTSGGPAEGSLLPGDVIVAVDDEPITDMSALVLRLRLHRPGDQVAVTYARQEERPATTTTRNPDGAFIGNPPVQETESVTLQQRPEDL